MSDAPEAAEGAFRRYEEIRPRLPRARFPATALHLPTLSEAADRFDGFILDAFGVLPLHIHLRQRLGALQGVLRFKAQQGVGLAFVLSQVVHIPLNLGAAQLFSTGLLPAPAPAVKAWLLPLALGLSAGICEEPARWLLFRARRLAPPGSADASSRSVRTSSPALA